MSENDISQNNLELPKNENLFYLTIPEISSVNKLLSYGYKLVDETDKDIQQYLKQKRIQERKLKKKKFSSTKQIIVDKKKLTERIHVYLKNN